MQIDQAIHCAAEYAVHLGGNPTLAEIILQFAKNLGPNYKKILRLSYDVIITYDNRKSNLR